MSEVKPRKDCQLERRAEMLAQQFGSRAEIVKRMPADWKPDAGWFEARGVKNV